MHWNVLCVNVEQLFRPIEKYLVKRYSTRSDVYVKPATTKFDSHIGQLVNVACDVHEILFHSRFNNENNVFQHKHLPNADHEG